MVYGEQFATKISMTLTLMLRVDLWDSGLYLALIAELPQLQISSSIALLNAELTLCLHFVNLCHDQTERSD